MTKASSLVSYRKLNVAVELDDVTMKNSVQWNPSCEAPPFAPEKWPFKRGGLSSGVKINTFMFRFTVSIGLSRGIGLLSGWPLKRGSTAFACDRSSGDILLQGSWLPKIEQKAIIH